MAWRWWIAQPGPCSSGSVRIVWPCWTLGQPKQSMVLWYAIILNDWKLIAAYQLAHFQEAFHPYTNTGKVMDWTVNIKIILFTLSLVWCTHFVRIFIKVRVSCVRPYVPVEKDWTKLWKQICRPLITFMNSSFLVIWQILARVRGARLHFYSTPFLQWYIERWQVMNLRKILLTLLPVIDLSLGLCFLQNC